MKIKDPLTELLAIKLYEHDAQDGRWPLRPGNSLPNWMSLGEEERELFRQLARGEREISDAPIGG